MQDLISNFSTNIQFVQMDPEADHINGSVPQDEAHIGKFIDKSALGPNNHIVLLSEKGGTITEAAAKYGVTPMLIDDFSAEKLNNHVWKNGPLYN